MKQHCLVFLFAFLSVFTAHLQAQTPFVPVVFDYEKTTSDLVSHTTESLPQHPAYIQNQICFSHSYPFVNYHKNYIEWENYLAVAPFFDKLKQSGVDKVKILHIGDSHIQADIYPSQVRRKLHATFGNSGRGMVFPYSAARTHAGTDYVTFSRGRWDYAKNVQWQPKYELGISGITIHTKDKNASFMIKFKENVFENTTNTLKIYCKKSKESFDLELVTSGLSDVIHVDCNDDSDNLPYVTVQIPEEAGEILQFSVVKNNDEQHFFECNGLLFEKASPKGIAYNCAGVNGAGFRSFAKQNLLPEQIAEFKPDLIIVDLGINDFYPLRRLQVPQMAQMIKSFIDMLQIYSPKSAILLVSVQEACHRQKGLESAQEFSQLARQIAYQKNCAFYDFYEVSGGRNAMLQWQKGGLAKRDLLHLTSEGYQHKGELLANALINAYHLSLTKKDSLLHFTLNDAHRIDSTYRTFSVFMNPPNLQGWQNEQNQETAIVSTDAGNIYESNSYEKPKQTSIYYQVKNGDNLGSIAIKFHTTVHRLQTWNRIKGSAIRKGQTLVIHQGNYKENYGENYSENSHETSPQILATQQTNKKSKKNPVVLAKYQPNTSNAKTHKVKRGDNLWGIAKKYHITVEKLTQMNNLANNALQIGQVLRLQ